MHGELIEFNERLHRALVAKDALVSQMRQELIDLRGPVSAPTWEGLSLALLLALSVSQPLLPTATLFSLFILGNGEGIEEYRD